MIEKKKIKILKLGGAFFDPKHIKNFFKFFNEQKNEIYVVSAVKGVTRLLEMIYQIKTQKDVGEEYKKEVANLSIEGFIKIHQELINNLFEEEQRTTFKKVFDSLVEDLKNTIFDNFENQEKYYSKILKFGELASSKILSAYLSQIGSKNIWFDARDYVLTDDNHKKAQVVLVRNDFKKLFQKAPTLVTQGFIGKSVTGHDTVLGYDGSDRSASEFAITLSKEVELDIEITFFKDVIGVFKGNPKEESNLEMFSVLTYKEYLLLVEQTGSFVVRPDSISALAKAENKIITKIKSYIDVDNSGTIISH